MLSLYLLRHGETEFSQQDRFCGRIDPPLTGGGREMAARFASAYGALEWRAIVTSTRIRAIESATPLALQHRPGGRDRRAARRDVLRRLAGALEAGDCRARRRLLRALATRSEHRTAAGRVAARRLGARARRDPGSAGAPPGGPLLVVSHKAVLRILLCQLFGIELRHYRRGRSGRSARSRRSISAPAVRRCAGSPTSDI